MENIIVDKSLSGQSWAQFTADEPFCARLAQEFNVPDIVARIINARQVPLSQAEHYIKPQLKTLLPDPYVLKDMDKAADRIAKAIIEGESIGVFGDYDVDGATASAIMHRFLRMAGVQEGKIFIHIPDRLDEGYGLNAKGLKELYDKGASLAIAVDCGITGFDAVNECKDFIDIVIADHHESEVKIPAALAVVDAKRVDDTSGLNNLAACGVSFLLSVAVNRILRDKGHYKDKTEPELINLLDLVAFGTVCDVVPLTGVNRAFVSQGLKVLGKRKNMGLKALCDIGNIASKPTAFHLGYVLGPRINAGGRVGDAATGERLLSTEDRNEAAHLAQKLDNFNTERREIETAVIQAAENKIAGEITPDDTFIFISGENWHTGVIGIIAGRIKEKYRLPTLVATIDPSGIANGSGRSVAGVDLGSAIIKAKESGILIEGGGHSMAAGFTLKQENIPAFKQFLKDYIASAPAAVPTLKIDAVIDISGISIGLIEKLEILEPFGAGNEEPRFAILNAKLTGADAIGGGNIRAYFSSDNGKGIQAILYRGLDTEVGEALLSSVGSRFKLAGKIRINEYMSKRNIQLVLDDVAKV